MTFHATDPERTAQDAHHITLSHRFWTPTEHRHDPADSPSQPASGGHPGDAAVSDAPPSLHALRDARKHLRRLGISVARPAAVTPVPRIPVVHPSFVSFAAERIQAGPWGPSAWVVSNVVTGKEVARYPGHEVDGPGAILRYLQEQQGCQEQRQRVSAAKAS